MTSTTRSEQGATQAVLDEEGRGSSDTSVRRRQGSRVSVAAEGVKMNDESSSTTSEDSDSTKLQEIAIKLAASVDFFREHAPDIAELRAFPYTRFPSYCDRNRNGLTDDEATRFEQRKRLLRDVTHFPLLPKKGKLQVPMALVCETEDRPHGNLVIINYWRQLKACRQRELKTSMQRFYVRPNVNNERLNLSPLHTRAPMPSSSSVSASPSPTCDGQTVPREHERRQRGRIEAPTPWGFRCLETCTQLAEALNLYPPKFACDLLRTANLEVPSATCKSEDCAYPSLARNHGYCCRHGLHFGPTPGKVNGRRGYLLLGDVYTRPYLAIATTISSNKANLPSGEDGNNTRTTVKKLTTCSCRNEICVGIGFSPAMIQFDVHRFPKDLRDAIWSNRETLNMTARTQFQISRNKPDDENTEESRSSVLRLAPWHFHPEHREFLPNGTWKFLNPSRILSSSTNRTDLEGNLVTPKEWKGLPLPTYSPKQFLEEPAMKEFAARKTNVASTTDMLPSWCREYSKLEEGPFSIAEVQRNSFWNRTIELEEELASRIMSFRTKERALEAELEKLQGKYDEKKFLKRRDKKRKRSSNNKNKNNSATSSGKASPSSIALQDSNKSKKKRSETTDKTARSPSDYLGEDGRSNTGAEITNGSERHDSPSPIKPTHPHDSHRMEPVHYNNLNNSHPQQHEHQQHHQHHQYPHSYPPHLPQHRPHHQHVHPNRAADMDLRHHPPPHYHQHPQPPEESYPQQHHHQAYHPRHDDGEDQYRDHPPEHPSEAQQQQQQQEERQPRPRHYSEQQDWHRGYYE